MIRSRRGLVRTVSFLTATVAVLAIWAGVNAYKLSVMKMQMQVSRERALTQLGTYLDDIDINLQKCMYCSSGEMLADVSSKLWRSSASAKESLSEITDGNTEVSGVYKFLSQVGEYTLSLYEKVASGKKLSQEETQNIEKLKTYSSKLSQDVNYLIDQQESGGLDFEEVKSTLQSEGDETLYLAAELNDANQAMEDYPTLIYDGPFSDHIGTKESKLVSNLEKVSQKEAQKKAAEFLGLNEDELYFLNKTECNLNTFTFYNNSLSISVTEKGGLVSAMLTSRYAGETTLSNEQAIKKATQFLKERGYKKVKESYYSTSDGICTINFAYYENGITFYTDLIKVSVALDNGDITAFDATGYLMNHKNRTVPQETEYTLESAEALIRKDLQVVSSKKAFIPTDWETEEYAFEYHCKARDGQDVLVYIDPETGEELDILILLYSDGGILTK